MDSIQYAVQHKTAYKRLESISVWLIQFPLILPVICGVAERLRFHIRAWCAQQFLKEAMLRIQLSSIS